MRNISQNNPWKAVAIVFIVLFVLETIFFLYFINIGITAYNNDQKCSHNICEVYSSYYYDGTVCYCYNMDGEVVKTEYIE